MDSTLLDFLVEWRNVPYSAACLLTLVRLALLQLEAIGATFQCLSSIWECLL